MGFEEWREFVTDLGLLDRCFTLREATLCFVWQRAAKGRPTLSEGSAPSASLDHRIAWGRACAPWSDAEHLKAWRAPRSPPQAAHKMRVSSTCHHQVWACADLAARPLED